MKASSHTRTAEYKKYLYIWFETMIRKLSTRRLKGHVQNTGGDKYCTFHPTCKGGQPSGVERFWLFPREGKRFKGAIEDSAKLEYEKPRPGIPP
jgi:hypothetical protein